MSALSGHLFPRARRHARVRRPAGIARHARVRQAALAAGVGVLGLMLAYVLVRRSAALAFALVLLPVVLWSLLRPSRGLLFGLALMLVVPDWLGIGIGAASVLRVASLIAASSLLFGARSRLVPTDFAVLLFVVVTVLGWLLQYNQPHVGRLVLIELTPVGFYLGARTIPRSHMPAVAALMLAAGTAAALTVIYEYVIGQTVFVDPFTYAWRATDSTLFRPGGIFGSAPGAATVMCVVILFGHTARAYLPRRLQALSWVGTAICALALLLTFTRAGLIACAVGIVCFMWMRRSPLLRPLRVAWGIGVLTLVVLLLLPSLQRNGTFQQGIIRPGNLSGRESYWSAALPIATASAHNLVLGLGTGSLETPVQHSNAPVKAELAASPQVFVNSLHSEYMTTLVEQGLVGLAVLLALLAAPLVPVVRAARAESDRIAAGIAASIIAISIVMLVDTALLDAPTLAVLMTLSGMAASIGVARRTARRAAASQQVTG